MQNIPRFVPIWPNWDVEGSFFFDANSQNGTSGGIAFTSSRPIAFSCRFFPVSGIESNSLEKIARSSVLEGSEMLLNTPMCSNRVSGLFWRK